MESGIVGTDVKVFSVLRELHRQDLFLCQNAAFKELVHLLVIDYERVLACNDVIVVVVDRLAINEDLLDFERNLEH